MATEQTTDEEFKAPTPATVAAQIAPRRLTQADLDREVARALRDAENGLKPADYDEFKAEAERASELEGRIASLQGEISQAQLESLRVSVASRFGVSEEDRDLLMTGTDEETLALQAERLGSLRRSMGNVAPNEGRVVQMGDRGDRDMSAFVNQLFDNNSFWD